MNVFDLPEEITNLGVPIVETKEENGNTNITDDNISVNKEVPITPPINDTVVEQEDPKSLYEALKLNTQLELDIPEDRYNDPSIISEFTQKLVEQKYNETIASKLNENADLAIINDIVVKGGTIDDYLYLKEQDSLYANVDVNNLEVGQMFYIIQESLLNQGLSQDLITPQIELLQSLNYEDEATLKNVKQQTLNALNSLQNINRIDKYREDLSQKHEQILKQYELAQNEQIKYISSKNIPEKEILTDYIFKPKENDVSEFILVLDDIITNPKNIDDKLALAHFIKTGGLKTHKEKLLSNTKSNSTLNKFFK